MQHADVVQRRGDVAHVPSGAVVGERTLVVRERKRQVTADGRQDAEVHRRERAELHRASAPRRCECLREVPLGVVELAELVVHDPRVVQRLARASGVARRLAHRERGLEALERGIAVPLHVEAARREAQRLGGDHRRLARARQAAQHLLAPLARVGEPPRNHCGARIVEQRGVTARGRGGHEGSASRGIGHAGAREDQTHRGGASSADSVECRQRGART